MDTRTNPSFGLTEKEATARIHRFGKNTLVQKGKFIFLKELFYSFFSPLVLLLLGASLVSAFLGDIPDFLIIFGIVLASGSISFAQHFKAEHASQRLKSKVILTATVIRDGKQKEIPFPHVTVGDVVLLSVGDLVPADMQLLETRELSIDESMLTGESYPAEKKAEKEKDNKQTKAFAGTHAVTGEATGIVFAIGKGTQMGKLSEKIIEQKPKTAFDKQLESFSILVVRLILVLATFVFLVNAIFHHNILSSFLFSVALAVGLTPELMPAIITISLSRGALKMEEKEVIVKFLPGIQNLGGMDILCMDKTGTITENSIVLSSYENAEKQKVEDIVFLAKVNSHFQSGFKNPLDHALLSLGLPDVKTYKKIDEIPFDFERKKMSVIVQHGQQTLLITKGAPQKILQDTSFIEKGGKDVKMTAQKMSLLVKRAEQLAEDGYRVIALAKKKIARKDAYAVKDEEGLTFLGFLIFVDPVKNTVSETLKKLLALGISPKILTGDNEIITKKVCKDAGITVEKILTGEEIQKMSEEKLASEVASTTIFAELTPQQKARIILLFRKHNHVVGYLGDGINDAPPLKAADIGISVNNGSDIAKDVADVILMRKSLDALTDGVIEGRKTYANTFKYIMMSLSSNFGNMMSVAIASIFLPFLPLIPVQIILLDFLYDLSQIAVPSDTVDESTIQQPRKWSMTFLKRFTFFFGPISSVFDLITFSVLLFFLHSSIPAFRTGWFVESFLTQTLIIFAIRTPLVPFFKSLPSKILIASCLGTIFMGGIIVFSNISIYFSFINLPNIFWLILVVEIIFYFFCVEITKQWFYKKLHF